MIDYLLATVAKAHARHVLRGFLRATRRATRTQTRVLMGKLRRNAESDFGREHKFGTIRTYADFAERVPILRYDDLAPYVERVRNGDLSALFGPKQRVLMFAMSSGTTDRPKYVPVTEAFLREYRRGWNVFGVKALVDHPKAFLKPIVQVTSRMDEETAPSGVPCGAITGLMAAMQKRIVRKYYASLPCVARIEDAATRYYTVMRLAAAVDVGFMITANPATQLKLARTGDACKEQIIRDVHDGTLDSRLEVPEDVRAALAPRLKARPKRAKALEEIVRQTGRLLPKDMWNLGFGANWTGGTMGLYLRDFPEHFGKTPVRDIGLLASEGRMSIPLEDGTPCGVLDVTSNFYEFIPVSEYESAQPTVLLPHDLEVGQDYYILLTTSAGFYRYDIADVVRVHGFYGQAPVIEFLNKGAHISSLTGEKLSESQVVLAVERACTCLGIEPGLFVLAPQWAEPPHYRLYMEPPDASPDELAALEREMESALGHVNIEYASKRNSGRLGPVRLSVLPAGFLAERDLRLSTRHRKANEQFKHQYLLPSPGEDKEFPRGEPVRPAGVPASE